MGGEDCGKGDELEIFKEQNHWGAIGSNSWISLEYTERI
jgi:hypothetical protein